MYQFHLHIQSVFITILLIVIIISFADCGKDKKGGHTIIVSNEKEKCHEVKKKYVPVPIPVPTYRHGRSMYHGM